MSRRLYSRPAVTLMEVLIAMFIMAIGMMALLVLFPVGAVSMGQALKDDRCAYASTVAENVAIINNVRYGDGNTVTALNASPSGLVYVDPYGVNQSMPPLGGIIPRVSPSFITNGGAIALQLTDRWFSLADDISFGLNGAADTGNTGGVIDTGRRYSFAYLLRRSVPASVNLAPVPVQLYAVVYAGRPVSSLATTPTEYPYTLVTQGAVGSNSVVISGVSLPGLKRGGWILEPANGYFYRVTNLAEAGGSTTVELETNLKGSAPIASVVGMDFVAEVFDKGSGWQQ